MRVLVHGQGLYGLHFAADTLERALGSSYQLAWMWDDKERGAVVGGAGVRLLIPLIQNVSQNSNFGMKAQIVSATISIARYFPRSVSVTLFTVDKVSTRYTNLNHHRLFSHSIKQNGAP